jgi:hypothetical protein
VTNTLDYKIERRREHRVRTEEAVVITLLGPMGGPPIPSTVIDISGSGLRILSPRPFPCGVLLKVEGRARLLLGEVLRSEPAGDSFAIGIKVSHALHALEDLERLNRELHQQTAKHGAESFIMKK